MTMPEFKAKATETRAATLQLVLVHKGNYFSSWFSAVAHAESCQDVLKALSINGCSVAAVHAGPRSAVSTSCLVFSRLFLVGMTGLLSVGCFIFV